MTYRTWKRFFSLSLPVLLVTVPLLIVPVVDSSALLAAPYESAQTASRLHVVLLNDGGRPSINYYSHLLHIKQFTEILRRVGISSRDITVFNAAGAELQADFAVRDPQGEPSFWLLEGTQLERSLRPQIRLENSTIDDFTLQPATRVALRSWFEEAAQRLQSGDTLLFYGSRSRVMHGVSLVRGDCRF